MGKIVSYWIARRIGRRCARMTPEGTSARRRRRRRGGGCNNLMQFSLVYTGGPSAGSRVSFPLQPASIGCLGLVALDEIREELERVLRSLLYQLAQSLAQHGHHRVVQVLPHGFAGSLRGGRDDVWNGCGGSLGLGLGRDLGLGRGLCDGGGKRRGQSDSVGIAFWKCSFGSGRTCGRGFLRGSGLFSGRGFLRGRGLFSGRGFLRGRGFLSGGGLLRFASEGVSRTMLDCATGRRDGAALSVRTSAGGASAGGSTGGSSDMSS